MNIDQAYGVLGLRPIDGFIKHQMDFNMLGIPDTSAKYSGQGNLRYRGIGATTWMLVSAAIQMEKTDVLIVAHTNGWQRKLQERLEKILKDLKFSTGWERRNNGTALASRGHYAQFSTNKANLNGDMRVVGNATRHGMPFEDVQWKIRAIRRSKGPFGMVREIRFRDGSWANSDNKYLAFAEDDEFLFELTEEGALGLVEDDPGIKRRGWKEPPQKEYPSAQPFGSVDNLPATSNEAVKRAMTNLVADPSLAKPGQMHFDQDTQKLMLLTEAGDWIEVITK